MAHGSKKWITTYDGRIKRSNDRTKKDYYGDLKKWRPMEDRWGSRMYGPKHQFPASFCPQCKHVMKDAVRIREENSARHRRLWSEYHELYDAASLEWRAYRYEARWNRVGDVRPLGWSIEKPKVPEPPRFHDWVENEKKELSWHWHFDDRNFLCFKCERKNDVKDGMWRVERRNFGGRRRDERRKYRSKMKHLMRNERYDDLIPRKHDWLD
jgi:hypothetical protein